MSKNRYATHRDSNESQVIEDLEKLGCVVERDHDDFLMTCQGFMFWIELKSENALKKDGNYKKGAVKKSQKKIKELWNDTYIIALDVDGIIKGVNKVFKQHGLRTVRIR